MIRKELRGNAARMIERRYLILRELRKPESERNNE